MTRAVLIMLGLAAVAMPSTAEARRGGHHGHHKRGHGHRVAAATVVVDNVRPEAIQVYASGRYMGMVAPGAALRLAVAPGSVALQVRSLDGMPLEQQNLWLSGAETHRVLVQMQPATFRLRNDSGVALTVYDGRQVVARLHPGEHEAILFDPGRHDLRAVYLQHGQERVLRAKRVTLQEGEERSLRLRPDDSTLVAVNNALQFPATLVVSGAPVGTLMPGEQRLIEVPVGMVDLAMVKRGRVVDAARLSAAPYLDTSWVAQLSAQGRPQHRRPGAVSLSGRYGRLLFDVDLPLAIAPDRHRDRQEDRARRDHDDWDEIDERRRCGSYSDC